MLLTSASLPCQAEYILSSLAVQVRALTVSLCVGGYLGRWYSLHAGRVPAKKWRGRG